MSRCVLNPHQDGHMPRAQRPFYVLLREKGWILGDNLSAEQAYADCSIKAIWRRSPQRAPRGPPQSPSQSVLPSGAVTGGRFEEAARIEAAAAALAFETRFFTREGRVRKSMPCSLTS